MKTHYVMRGKLQKNTD